MIKEGITVPWEHPLDIVEQSDNKRIEGYIAIYPLVPASFQATIIDRLWDFLNSTDFAAYSENSQISGYCAAYSHMPQQLQEMIITRFWKILDSSNVIDIMYEFIAFTKQLDQILQTPFWEYLVQQDLPTYWVISILNHIPDQWKADLRQRIQASLKDLSTEIIPHKLKRRNHLNILGYFEFLSKEKQILAYWGISFEMLLEDKDNYKIIELLPADERQAYLDYILETDLVALVQSHYLNQLEYTSVSNDVVYIITNILELAKHNLLQEAQLLNKGLELLLAYPQHSTREIITLLSDQARKILAKQILQTSVKQLRVGNINYIIQLVPYVPELSSVLIELILELIPITDNEEQQEKYIALLPQVEIEQRPAVIEQAWLSSRYIDSHYVQIDLEIGLSSFLTNIHQTIDLQRLLQRIQQYIIVDDQVYLFDSLLKKYPDLRDDIFQTIITSSYDIPERDRLMIFCNQQQNQAWARKIFDQYFQKEQDIPLEVFPYISVEQQDQVLDYVIQNGDTYSAQHLLQGLISIPNYPHLELLPFIEKVTVLYFRLRLLGELFPKVADNKQAREAITEQQNCIADSLLQNIEEHFLMLFSIRSYFIPDIEERVREEVWNYAQTHNGWPFKPMIENASILEYYANLLSSEQIQASFNYLLADNKVYQCKILIPYLNQEQLTHFYNHMQQYAPSALLDFYQKAHVHHGFLNQSNYYQDLLSYLHTEQDKRENWAWIKDLCSMEPYLQGTDFINLFQKWLEKLNLHYVARHTSSAPLALLNTIDTLKEKGLINKQTIQRFIEYARHQDRRISLEMLSIILPPYLETLESEQQQELASLIMQSVNQVVECWP